MQVLILSPHRDDAAFSCGLLLGGLLQAGHSLRIVNVCTISSYAPYLEESAADRVQQVSTIRLNEDLRFVQSLLTETNRAPDAVNMMDLNWNDLPLRWQTEDSASLAPASLRLEEVDALQNALGRLPSADLVLCPKALGGHMDHRLVCRAAQRAFPLSSIVFYEDLPYACGALSKPSVEIEDLQGLQEAWLTVKNLTPGLKRRLCVIYTSQIDVAAAEAMDDYGNLHGGERFMALPQTLLQLRAAVEEAGAIA